MFDSKFKRPLLALAVAGIAAPALAGDVAEPTDGKIEAGTLTCELTGITNVIVYTNETFDCLFEGVDGTVHKYEGQIDSIGVNLEFKAGETLVWTVIAPATVSEKGLLAGEYVGASAGASVGAGVSGNVLVGGSSDQFALQPLAASVTSGVGAAVTLDNFTLSSAQ